MEYDYVFEALGLLEYLVKTYEVMRIAVGMSMFSCGVAGAMMLFCFKLTSKEGMILSFFCICMDTLVGIHNAVSNNKEVKQDFDFETILKELISWSMSIFPIPVTNNLCFPLIL